MCNKKNFMAAAVFVMMTGLTGCGEKEQKAAEPPVQEEVQISSSENQEEAADTPVQEEAPTPSAENHENTAQGEADVELEKELERYRQEREDMIQEANGLVEGGSPEESNYSFDMSGSFYGSQFDTRETTEAYAAAGAYITDELGVTPETKMTTYMCIDPRILAIYDEEDKGVAAGYENDNIFVCEYKNEEGTWQYLILVRDRKGSAWHVIHNGSSYKE